MKKIGKEVKKIRYKSFILITVTALLLSSQMPLAVWGNWEVVLNVTSTVKGEWVHTEDFVFTQDFQYKIHWYVSFGLISMDISWELEYHWYQGYYDQGEWIKGWSHEGVNTKDWSPQFNDIGLKSYTLYYVKWKIVTDVPQEEVTVRAKIEQSVTDLSTTSTSTSATSFAYIGLLAIIAIIIIKKKRKK